MVQNSYPDWIRVRYLNGETNQMITQLLDDLKLHTVCQSARCPNQGSCFNQGTATFMILGDICTRNCHFCAIQKGAPSSLDEDEPRRLAEAVKRLKLDYVVITSVTRDDLEDGGASVFAQTIKEIRTASFAFIEILTPDFQGKHKALEIISNAQPSVFNHNLETVSRLYSTIRPQANYHRSLWVLSTMKKLLPSAKIKSGLMVGLGERESEVIDALHDLRETGCDFITIGQYLAPSNKHYPVVEYVHPEQFFKYQQIALSIGFIGVASGPLVRSSYHAKKMFEEALL